MKLGQLGKDTTNDGSADAPVTDQAPVSAAVTGTAPAATVAPPAATVPAEAQPPHGGSFLRKEDGSLELVERTAIPAPGAVASTEPGATAGNQEA